MGFKRAGFYGYDLIENIGSPRGIRSADQIIPELQRLEVGDTTSISLAASLVVHSIERNRELVWAGLERPPNGSFSWSLSPVDAEHTRLISRIRFRHQWLPVWVGVLNALTEFTDHTAVRKILLGVKDRTEGRPAMIGSQLIDLLVWLIAAAELLIAVFLIVKRAAWGRAWAFALAAGVVLQLSFYALLPLWACIVAEALIAGGLVRFTSDPGESGSKKALATAAPPTPVSEHEHNAIYSG